MKAALRDLVRRFDISGEETRISFETFATESTLHNTLNNVAYHRKDAILDLITDSINKVRGSPTRLDRAVKTAKEQMFTKQNGLRTGVRKAIVLYTDGRTHERNTEDFYQDIVTLKVQVCEAISH